jgi:hypothetical protein
MAAVLNDVFSVQFWFPLYAETVYTISEDGVTM